MRRDANEEDTSGYASPVEAIERDAWMDIYAAVPPALADEAGIKSQRLRSLGMLANRGIGIVEFNRALGFGLSPLAQSSVLTSVLEWLDANAGSAWVVQPVPGSEAAAEIRRLGFEAVGNGWAKFVGKIPSAMNQAARTELAVELVDHTSAGTFGQMVATGFGLPSSVEPWFAALVGRPSGDATSRTGRSSRLHAARFTPTRAWLGWE